VQEAEQSASVIATTPSTVRVGGVCDRVVMRAYGCVELVCDHACGRGQMEEAGASEGAGVAGQESLSSKLERQIQELESLRLQKIDCLRQENERLQKENERLRQENESLRKENERLQKLANNRLQRLASELHRKRSRPDS
jgi:septal ring factor EnvC (AmiA/AmiB activator)